MPVEEVAAKLGEGLQYFRAGMLDAAEQVYRRVLAAHRDVPDAWNMLALVLFSREKLDEAEQASERATALRPSIPPYWLTRGNIQLALNRLQDARASFERAIKLDPEFAEARYRLGIAWHRERRIDEAIAAYRHALRRAPDVAEIHFQLAEALAWGGRWDDAMREYESAFVRDGGRELDRRGAFECLGHLQFDALPPLWQDEIERFFARDDIDESRYVGVGLRVLRTRPAFRSLLGAAEPRSGDPASQEVMRDRLFLRLLEASIIPDLEIEKLLTRLRGTCLCESNLRAESTLEFLGALALQCFNNEFVFAVSPEEIARSADLAREIGRAAAAGSTAGDAALRDVFTAAMYMPLAEIGGAESLLERHPHPAARKLLQRSVLDARKEDSIRQGIRAVSAITDTVSIAVRRQYEEHPYPRWLSFDHSPSVPVAEWLENEMPISEIPRDWPATVRVLVAGCGTGREAVWLASGITGAQVLAVDLSMSSLAYAARMAEELRVANIEFRQGDILGLDVLPGDFDLIFCNGVLHHLREPQAGLHVLAALLRRGGLMRLALYSARARSSVNASRDFIRERGYAAGADSIREFRQHVFAAGADSPLKGLCGMRDFYSMSMCRDLVFHVQEHQYGLPQIADMLRAQGLAIVGMANDMPRNAMAAYRQQNPRDRALADFDALDEFEAQHPDTFAGMFPFWCRLAADRK